MPNQSGTVTSSQGAVILGSSPNDTITFTPASGAYTVEYPLGTVAISGSSSAQTLALSGGQLRITCVSGSVAYALTDAPDSYELSQAQTVATQALVSGAGNAEDLAAFIAGDNLALRYVVRDYVAPGYIF